MCLINRKLFSEKLLRTEKVSYKEFSLRPAASKPYFWSILPFHPIKSVIAMAPEWSDRFRRNARDIWFWALHFASRRQRQNFLLDLQKSPTCCWFIHQNFRAKIVFFCQRYFVIMICVCICVYLCMQKCLKYLLNHSKLSGLFKQSALSLADSGINVYNFINVLG